MMDGCPANFEKSLYASELAAAAELYAKGHICAAAKLYRGILSLDEENVVARFNLGSCLSSLGRCEEAIEAYKSVLLKNPLDVDILYHLGLAFLDGGRLDEAERCFGFCLSIDGGFVRAHAPLANIHQLRGDREKAIACYRMALDCKEERETSAHMLAALNGERTERAPDVYIERFFDAYAATFEQSLLGIGYRVPLLLRELLNTVCTAPASYAHVLDLGCGTGLSGEAFRSRAKRMTGVDLAANMLRMAKKKNIYDRLVQAALQDFLEENREFFDLVLLTDVLVYTGKLQPLFHMLRQRLAPGGLLLFSTEKIVDVAGDYVLRSSGRYAHSPGYIEGVIGEAGCFVMARKGVQVRQQKGGWIEGDIYICGKRRPGEFAS